MKKKLIFCLLYTSINFDRIVIGNNDISATITYFSNGGINKIDLSWDKGIARVGGEETKDVYKRQN